MSGWLGLGVTSLLVDVSALFAEHHLALVRLAVVLGSLCGATAPSSAHVPAH